MVMYGDYRYVSEGEYAAFRSEDKRLSPGHPFGYAAMRAAFRVTGRYGKWIAGHNTVIRINDTIFVHAGLSPSYAEIPISEINGRVRSELEDFSKLRGGIVLDSGGPLWYRDLAEGAEAATGPEVESTLGTLKAARVAIGHTPTDGAILPRFGARVILTDVGLSRAYTGSGRLACLLIDYGKLYAVHRSSRLELPSGSGQELVAYLKRAAALDPLPSPLRKLIASLEAGFQAP
jgi:hypothetical protein